MGGEAGEEAGRVGGLIPHFFFDAIGRIVPGSFLIAGWLFEGWNAPSLSSLKAYIEKFNVSGPAVAFMVCLVASFIIGFLLGAVSFIVEKIWSWLRPWRPAALRKRYTGIDGKFSRLEETLREKLGLAFPSGERDHQSIHELSWLCAYYVWGANTNLGVLTSRWDAESLASRSLFVSSLGLATYALYLSHWGSMAFFGCCAIASFLAYNYHRKKQVFGRFDLFLACTLCEDKSESGPQR
jgi:hypothetical protein